ncbi:MAG TPA: hypothetical protein VJ851_06340 [Jatrophihabitans sp.]|nr:hypothetical protein [Jatrophihabitans sp.]
MTSATGLEDDGAGRAVEVAAGGVGGLTTVDGGTLVDCEGDID